MNNDKLKKYAELRAAKEAIEAQIAELGITVLGMLQASELEKLETEYGTFSVIEIPRWSYTKDVKAEENKIKELKKAERETGKAEKQTTTSLRFQA